MLSTGRLPGGSWENSITFSQLKIWRSCTPPYDLILGGPGGGFCGPGAGFGGPGGGFSDSRSSGKPLLLLRLKKPPPGAPKPPPGPPKPTKTKQKTKRKLNKNTV